MTGPRTWAAAALAALLVGACSVGGTDPVRSTASGGVPSATAGDQVAELSRMADATPAELVAQVRRAYQQTALQVSVTRSDAEGRQDLPYTWVALRDAWRVDLPAVPGDDRADRSASLLVTGGAVCFDRGFRSRLTTAVAQSYGVIDFDPQPWTCSPADFGLNQLATYGYLREDPRPRIDALVTDDPSVFSVQVDQQTGAAPLVHLRTTGPTAAGLLDPARPTYDLWIDSDHRPVRMETEGTTWDFDYPDELGARLAPPPFDQRGSYGYAAGPGPGPGQGMAKACQQSGQCPPWDPALTWGDGRVTHP